MSHPVYSNDDSLIYVSLEFNLQRKMEDFKAPLYLFDLKKRLAKYKLKNGKFYIKVGEYEYKLDEKSLSAGINSIRKNEFKRLEICYKSKKRAKKRKRNSSKKKKSKKRKVKCKCKSGCKNKKCTCVKNNSKCSKYCECEGCKNED